MSACVSVCTREVVCPCLSIEPERQIQEKGGEMGKVCPWRDMRMGGKREECTAVMGPIRLLNEAQTEA